MIEARTKGKASEIDIHLGSQLKLFRTLIGMSQEKLGKEAKVTFQQIQKYEDGANRISAARLYEFTGILKRTFDDFFEGYKNPYKNNEIKVLHSIPPETITTLQKIISIKNEKHQKAAIKAASDVIEIYAGLDK